ncbi:MAG TPA: hypothetical protein VMV32_11010 [Ignavibacteriaceae bacterium]|nr:hypothetical protein [Ignavibacteriaceae bacterium]
MDNNNGKEIVAPEEEEIQFNNDLEYSRSSVPTITDPNQIHDWVLNLQRFIKLCEAPLDKSKIKTYSQGSTTFKYVPIDIIETQAKKLFMGLIDEEDPHWQVIGNEIVATQKIRVFHPVAGIWIGLVGWAAIQIRMKKDSDITDPNNKLKNALQLDFPHLASEVYKNAFQKLGRQFGRGLRRDYLDEYEPLIESPEKKKQKKDSAISGKVLEETKVKVNQYMKLYSNPDKLKKDAFAIVEDAKKAGLDEVDAALLKNYINETIKGWK